jgi:hypothetical protein
VAGPLSLEARFWQNVKFTEHGLEWVGAMDGRYGRFRTLNRKKTRAHRFAYELLRGRLPDGAILDHTERCPRTCVTPGHMMIHFTRSDHAKAGWYRGEYDRSWISRSAGPKDPATGRFVKIGS